MDHVGKGRFCAFVLGLLLLGGATAALADDPVPGIVDQCQAPDGVITVYSVQPGRTADFLGAMIESSHFHSNRAAHRQMVNETIAQGIAEQGRPESFFSVVSMQNRLAVRSMTQTRNRMVAPFVTGRPESITVKVIEHLLANWGLEKGAPVTFVRVTPSGHGSDENPTEKYGTSLAYFKTGYSGQMSMLEGFKRGTSIEAVRADLTSRKGMSGASIYLDEKTNTFYAYSEYFDLGSTQLSGRNIESRHVGAVVENFQAR